MRRWIGGSDDRRRLAGFPLRARVFPYQRVRRQARGETFNSAGCSGIWTRIYRYRTVGFSLLLTFAPTTPMYH